ncbi:metal-sensitive transcriptional regulator [Priestia flexa]|uniref:Metal-sensitive transcriptional regulator n=1 Tax=Priestia flexa TaxID=86664 RepID=A0A1N6QP79_9BACI|nr:MULTISPECIES: metal-sensitive transcriptional regulator [Bacillaceae]OZT13972.1 cytoplasmic protein [Priestia aryabhattai]USY53685.1 metal-sensitive transcriptional regulator [Bacillus sp. 1780r2a1]AQX54460.1 cytoplasmic protein [Priestia flexa]KZB91813.1 cytoplasmic protein [Bacillus sp. VT 712]MBN8251975.1 metal-sensitive transcriptional regulator [Priestia flexa]
MNYTDQTKNRLKRVEGQVRGVLRMMEEDKDCKDVVTQLSAVRSAVDRTIAQIVALNLEQCIVERQQAGEETAKVVEEAIALLVKSR